MYNLIAKILALPMVFNFLFSIAKRRPYQHIYGAQDKKLYMERYWLFNPYLSSGADRKTKWFPISIRIHKIVKPDNDRHMHDHPWNARTFIVKGWYREERINSAFLRQKGESCRLKFKEYHKITHVSYDGVYTIFISGKYRGTWGFLVNGLKIKYKKYLGLE